MKAAQGPVLVLQLWLFRERLIRNRSTNRREDRIAVSDTKHLYFPQHPGHETHILTVLNPHHPAQDDGRF